MTGMVMLATELEAWMTSAEANTIGQARARAISLRDLAVLVTEMGGIGGLETLKRCTRP